MDTAITSWTDWPGTGNAGNISVTSDSLQILGGGNTDHIEYNVVGRAGRKRRL